MTRAERSAMEMDKYNTMIIAIVLLIAIRVPQHKQNIIIFTMNKSDNERNGVCLRLL